MATISVKRLILTSTLSILLYSHIANGECVICPNGLEYPDAHIPSADGTVSCTQAASIFSSYDRNSCVATQVGTIPICCPSQFQLIAKDNVCGWCDNGTGIETLEATFRGPLDGMGDATCADILPGVALATDTTGCSIYDYAEEFCCPNAQHAIDTVTDEGTENRDEPTGGGDIITTPTNCHFCDNGIEFPTARPMSGDDTTCQQVANIFVQIRSALSNNEMACNSYRQLEFSCCPDSIDISNPIGTGGEHVADDVVPTQGDEDDQSNNHGVGGQNSNSSNSETDQHVDSDTVVQSGEVTIDTEMEEAVLAGGADDGSSSERGGSSGGSTIGADDVLAAGDLVFNDKGSVTADKNTHTANNNNDGDNSGVDYDIIYPDEHSGSSLRVLSMLTGGFFGSSMLTMSCAMVLLLQLS